MYEMIVGNDNDEIILCIYDTPEELIEKYFECSLDEISEISGYDQSGEAYTIPIDQMFSNILDMKCWGFTNFKRSIHIWFDKDVEFRKLLKLLVHEKGHMTRPFHRNKMKEEIKSGKYEDAAIFGFDVAKLLLGDNVRV